MFFKNSKLIAAVRWIMGWNNGGVYKRIDENRELLQLLLVKSPDFVVQNSWVIACLESQDKFLTDLAATVSITTGKFMPRQEIFAYPRPWPFELVKLMRERIASSESELRKKEWIRQCIGLSNIEEREVEKDG